MKWQFWSCRHSSSSVYFHIASVNPDKIRTIYIFCKPGRKKVCIFYLILDWERVLAYFYKNSLNFLRWWPGEKWIGKTSYSLWAYQGPCRIFNKIQKIGEYAEHKGSINLNYPFTRFQKMRLKELSSLIWVSGRLSTPFLSLQCSM